MEVAEKNETSFYIPITKRDDEKRMVYGYASTEALDSDGEIITKAAMQDAIEQYMEFGAVREMHQHWAAGRTKEASFDDKGLYIGAKIVDDQAWEKVKQGVYNGFSIGGNGASKIGNKITKMNLKEISLVDRPANPECLIEVFKMEGAKRTMQLELEPVIPDAPQPHAAKPTAQADKIEKGMSTLARLANLYETLEYMRNEVHFEEKAEMDIDSALPTLIDEACEKVGALILAMAEEEVSEYTTKGEAMKVEKKEKEDLAERRKAAKEKLAARMKSYKDNMDKMEADMGKLDDEDMDSEKLDELETKIGKADESEEDDKDEKKKVNKVLTSIVDRAVEKAIKNAPAPVVAAAAPAAVPAPVAASPAAETVVEKLDGTAELVKVLKTIVDNQNMLVEKLGKTATPALALRAIEKDGKEIDIVKMAKDEPAKLEELIAKGDISRAEAFKQVLAGSPRQVVG